MKSKYIDVPLFLQGVDTAYCVPYSILGLAHYFGIRLSRERAIEICKASKTFGSSVREYTQGVKKIGLSFKRIKFNYKNVRKAIKSGHPVAVCYASSDKEGHFSTIVHAQKNARGIPFYTLNDTYFGQYVIPADVLRTLMKPDKSWARIVVQK